VDPVQFASIDSDHDLWFTMGGGASGALGSRAESAAGGAP